MIDLLQETEDWSEEFMLELIYNTPSFIEH